MQLIFAFSCTPNYYERAKPFLESVQKYANNGKVLFAPILNDNERFPERSLVSFGHIMRVCPIQQEDIQCLNTIRCIQHGEFLKSDFFDLYFIHDSDVVLFTDMDIIMQRPFHAHELALLENLESNTVCVGPNESISDTLAAEASRLKFKKSGTEVLRKFPQLPYARCYNTGVIAAQVGTWKNIVKKYTELWPEIDATFEHYAKQQWLLSYILHAEGYKVFDMPQSMHTHGHYLPLPAGTHTKDGTLYYNNEIVLFRHKC